MLKGFWGGALLGVAGYWAFQHFTGAGTSGKAKK
jgi:hypothetical protein